VQFAEIVLQYVAQSSVNTGRPSTAASLLFPSSPPQPTRAIISSTFRMGGIVEEDGGLCNYLPPRFAWEVMSDGVPRSHSYVSGALRHLGDGVDGHATRITNWRNG